MSPSTKKWSTYGGYAVAGAALAGVSMIPLAASDPDVWFKWIERVGLPTVGLVAVVMMIALGTRGVWEFVKPHVSGLFASAKHLFEKQTEFVEKCDQTQDEMKAMLSGGLERDKGMLAVLERIDRRTEVDSRKIDTIHSRVGGGR